jgi:hypothetical protein
MDYIGLGILGAMGIAGFLVIYKMADNKYPIVLVDVYDRGIKQRIKYRLLGKAVIKDNLFQILMNNFEICGNLNELEFDASPGGMGRWTRVYRAYRRHDYLFGLHHQKEATLKDPEGNEIEVLKTKTPPIIMFDEENASLIDNIIKVKARFSSDGLLVPYYVNKVNEGMDEKEVTNGKAICQRFVEMHKSTREYTDASNPVIATLLYSLPLFMIVIAIGVVLYLTVGEVNSMIIRVAETISKIPACA